MPASASLHHHSDRRPMLRTSSLLALSVLAVFSTVLQPQLDSRLIQDGQSQPMGPVMFGGPKDEPDRLAKRAMVKRLNADRQRQMAASTDRLLQLAADLKAQTGRPESDPKDSASQSAASAKKAEEIAKLAHSIRQKMAENYSSH